MNQSPIAYYDELGLLNDRFIAVHLADATASEIRLLAGRGVRAILSPSSNLHITGALPPLDAIAKYGMRFAFGTDGRGSNASIDVVGEARLLWEQAPELPAGRYLDALTSAGAEILQFEELGTIGRGARPGLLSVEVDAATDDVRSLERQILTSPASKRALH
jgi:5-methylthioadenosine/S-adenosylhomocysteine deaminase